MLFGICSGRPRSNLEKVFTPVANGILSVCENGAYAAYQGENILLESIAAENVADVVRDVRAMDGYSSMYNTGEICYFERGDEKGFEAMHNAYHFDCEMTNDLLNYHSRVSKLQFTEKIISRKRWRNHSCRNSA